MFFIVSNRIFNSQKSRFAPLFSLKASDNYYICNKLFRRCLSQDSAQTSKDETRGNKNSSELVIKNPKEAIQREFSDYFTDDGKFITRISYVDFIDQALEKLKDLGLNRNLEAYKELLRIFPPGKYHPKSSWDIGMFHAPQQLCAVRVLHQMEMNMVRPDREVEVIVVDAFSKNSDVWLKIARMNYWSMKGRNMDPNPLPDVLPKDTYELAKIALKRMAEDPKSVIVAADTSSLPDVIDKTWVVYSQSPLQRAMIDRLNEKSTLYIEESGLTYVNDKYLTYFALKVYDSEETVKRRAQKPQPDYNYNTLKMKFYGKPIKEKLEEMDEIHRVDDGYILAVGLTGSSSHDSVLSWLKLLQQRNPNLTNLNVVFRISRPTNDLLDVNSNEDPRS